jgi:hypothetical protein
VKVISLIIAELRTPGSGESVHHRATTAVGHAIVGAALVAPFGAWGLGAGLFLAVAYWWAKERGDLGRGGAVWDGLEDTVMVGLGAWYGAAWWPAVIVLAMGYIMAVAAWRRG